MVNKGPFVDRNLRLAAHHAIDKQALSRAFFGGKASPLSMLSPPGTAAHDAKFQFPYDLEKAKALLAQSGHSPSKPVKIKFFATNGAYASDFEIARAIVQMWRKIGIEADLQVLTLPEYLLRSQGGKLEGPALWSWYSATGSPVAYSYVLDPSKIFSAWKSADVSARFTALQDETDYARLTQKYRALEIWAVEQGYTLPLLQGTTTVVRKQSLKYAPFANGANKPYYWSKA
jgi:peptide/nickel transport system substrate-binding protein